LQAPDPAAASKPKTKYEDDMFDFVAMSGGQAMRTRSGRHDPAEQAPIFRFRKYFRRQQWWMHFRFKIFNEKMLITKKKNLFLW
jgi:hypothetical protein